MISAAGRSQTALLKTPHLLPMLLLAILTLASVTFLLSHLDPMLFPDSSLYEKLAAQILHGNLTDFTFRTPGYPVFLAGVRAIFGSGMWCVAAAQVILSAAVPFLLYGIFYLITQRTWIALLCACTYFLSWESQALSVAILTESLTQLLLIASTFFALLLARRPSRTLAAVAGISVMLLIMVRPAFLPLPYVYAALLAVGWWKRASLRQSAAAIALFLAIPTVCLLLWCMEIRRETGKFAISHITGIALLNQVSDQLMTVESSPDPEMVSLLQDAIRANNGQHLNVGWIIVQDQATHGVPEAQTAGRIKRLSIWLIERDPVRYMKKVLSNSREYICHTGQYIFADSKTHLAMMQTTFPGELYKFPDAQVRRSTRELMLFFFAITLAVAVLLLGRRAEAGIMAYLFPLAGLATCMFGHVLINGADLGRYNLPARALYLATIVASVYLVAHGIRNQQKIKNLPPDRPESGLS